MIPIRLELRNFLPYRAPDPLRFEGIHLACLTGQNGAGKSSILDAITWALWGKARTNRDEDLIHQGQDDMHVQLDFAQEDVVFRVLRKRSRAKRSSIGSLDLFRLNSEGKWKLDNEPSMRATQIKINALLRLDYETFVHSAFLQQGKADAFTTQTPAERKRLLSEILGLAQWAKYEEKTKERLKKIDEDLNFCEVRIAEINTELAREPHLKVELTAAQESHAEARAAYETAQNSMKELEGAPPALKAAKARKSEQEVHLRQYNFDLERVEADIIRQTERVTEYTEVMAKQADIEAGYEALRNARELDESLGGKLMELQSIVASRSTLNNQLTEARTRLESEITALHRSIRESQMLIDADPSADLEAVQEEAKALQSLDVQRSEYLRQETEHKERRAELNTLMKSLEAEGIAQRERLDTLQNTDSPTCPLCGQELSDEHREKVIADLTLEIDTMREEYKATRLHSQEVSQQINAIGSEIKALEADLKLLPSLNERAGKLAAQVDSAAQASIRIVEDGARLEQLQTELETEDYALDVREALAALDHQQYDIGYDQSTHDDARRSLSEYHQFEQLWTRLEVASKSLPEWQGMLDGSYERQRRLSTSIDETLEMMAALDNEIIGLTAQEEEYNRREAEVRAQHTLERSAYERFVNVQQALNSLDEQRSRKAQLEVRREKLRYDEAIYKELRTAFGKNGVPAMMIETAIPELETSANDLLSRMSDGRMNLRLLTQREKITGGQTETLDIEISDELGTRNYELYSGGEAFRINFAVRVALSQLLARRAGAHLRTLFIDEGFGTQDDAGRNKLVEAITAIQDEFDLILVITHIDELRDSFPVHVMVDKTPNGSRISVR